MTTIVLSITALSEKRFIGFNIPGVIQKSDYAQEVP